ncbi:MAG: helix-turn-helix transcriptional regulator, partial [Microcystaceae cyanobacterium]
PHAVIPYEVYEKLVEDAEMLSDIKAYDEAKARDEESFPADVVYRMVLEDENPIKVLREYRNLTQEQLAQKAGGISRVYISDIESGRKSGSVKVLKAIAKALDVDINMLVI